MNLWLAVALGGAAGSVARYGVGQILRGSGSGWPWGTLLVNVLGSLAIGVLFAVFLLRPVPDWVRLGVLTGLLGGFTTFSAFSLETLALLRDQGMASAGAYMAASLVLGLLACAGGLWGARLLLA